MNKNYISRILGVTCLGIMSLATTADAKTEINLLIHTNNSTEQSIPLKSIHQFTFSENALIIKFKAENPMSILYNDLAYLAFEEEFTAIEELPADNELLATYRPADQSVVVKATAPILSVRVYNMQGSLVLQATPQATEAVLPLDAPEGIYVVVASTEGNTISQKFIKH